MQVVRAGGAEFAFAASRIKALSREMGTELEVKEEERLLVLTLQA